MTERTRVLVRRWHQATSLCTGSTEIHGRVCRSCAGEEERSSQGVLSGELEALLELTLVAGLGGGITVPDEGHIPRDRSLLVPQHDQQAVVVMATQDFYAEIGRASCRERV